MYKALNKKITGSSHNPNTSTGEPREQYKQIPEQTCKTEPE